MKSLLENDDPDQLDHLFVNIQLFLEGAHKDFMKGVQKYKGKIPSRLEWQIVFFDEEIYRFLSSLSQYYTEEELKSKISNWDYFENKIQKLAKSSNASLKRSYTLKFIHNRAEREKADKDENYVPKYYSG